MGAEMLSPLEAVDIRIKDKYKTVVLSDGSEVNTLSVIIATGVSYRRLEKKGINDFTGAGIYYGSANTEAKACEGKDVYIVEWLSWTN